MGWLMQWLMGWLMGRLMRTIQVGPLVALLVAALLRFHCLKAGYPPSGEVDKEDVEAAAVEVDREVARAHSPSSVSNCSGAPPLLKLFPSHFGYKI